MCPAAADRALPSERKKVVERILREGHEIQNHGTHDYPAWKYGKEEFVNQLQECERVLEGAVQRFHREYVEP